MRMKKTLQKQHSKTAGLALAPYSVWSLLFILVPLVFVAYYAFTDESFRFTTENITRFYFYAHLPCYGLSYGVYHRTCKGTHAKNTCHTHYDTDVDELPYPYICVDDNFAGYRYLKQYDGCFWYKTVAYNRYGNGGYHRNGL